RADRPPDPSRRLSIDLREASRPLPAAVDRPPGGLPRPRGGRPSTAGTAPVLESASRMSTLRAATLDKLDQGTFDVLVLGGGINGAVSAAALAGRGASVALIDRGDFAGFTSQQSSNLAWGGIKYMESFEFGLVRKLCKSRNHLIRSYPSTVQEI